MDVTVPDAANYDFGDKPIPDNFLDETLNRALGQHRRKESQIQSVEDDFAEILDANVASNIAANLIGYIHTDEDTQNDNNSSSQQQQQSKPRDPDEDDVRVGNDDEDNNNENGYGLDEMLIETVTAHKHRESRTDFVTQKLHEMFPQDPEEADVLDGYGVTAGGDNTNNADTFGGGKIDMSQIASNLVAFLHDDHGSKPQTPQYPPNEEVTLESSENGNKPKAKRGSTNLSLLQQEIEKLQSKVNNLESQLNNKENKNRELNHRVSELENKNHDLMNEIRLLQNSKTTLAINSTKCIDELRDILVQYQKQLNLTSD